MSFSQKRIIKKDQEGTQAASEYRLILSIFPHQTMITWIVVSEKSSNNDLFIKNIGRENARKKTFFKRIFTSCSEKSQAMKKVSYWA